jgi:hypothetical protein
MEIFYRSNQCDRTVLRQLFALIDTTSVCHTDNAWHGYDPLSPAPTGIGFHQFAGFAHLSIVVSICAVGGIPGIWKTARDGA